MRNTKATCPHHWVIETPGGPVSTGVCKLCGAQQEFRNSLSVAGWERETFSERLARSPAAPAEDDEAAGPGKEPSL